MGSRSCWFLFDHPFLSRKTAPKARLAELGDGNPGAPDSPRKEIAEISRSKNTANLNWRREIGDAAHRREGERCGEGAPEKKKQEARSKKQEARSKKEEARSKKKKKMMTCGIQGICSTAPNPAWNPSP